jgi:hypothetical protein
MTALLLLKKHLDQNADKLADSQVAYSSSARVSDNAV